MEGVSTPAEVVNQSAQDKAAKEAADIARGKKVLWVIGVGVAAWFGWSALTSRKVALPEFLSCSATGFTPWPDGYFLFDSSNPSHASVILNTDDMFWGISAKSDDGLTFTLKTAMARTGQVQSINRWTYDLKLTSFEKPNNYTAQAVLKNGGQSNMGTLYCMEQL